MQQEVNNKTIQVKKIGTHPHVVDLMTKHLSKEKMQEHLDHMHFRLKESQVKKPLMPIGKQYVDEWFGKRAALNDEARECPTGHLVLKDGEKQTVAKETEVRSGIEVLVPISWEGLAHENNICVPEAPAEVPSRVLFVGMISRADP